jgi:tripartite-type tricarboxylate transporter receptor subunit TctC
VIVQNLTGASGFAAINHVYTVGPHDGTRMILPTVAAPTAKALGSPGVRWDTLKFQWLGNLVRDSQACVASGRSGIRSIEEAAEREIIFGSDGEGNSTARHPRLIANLVGYRLRIITGYQGTSQVRLAMETGEVEAVCSFWASSALGPQRADMESGKLVPIVQMGSRKVEIFADAPLVYDLAKTDEDRQVMRFIFGPGEISRPFGVAPDVPAARVAALREAFWAAATSAELKADAERVGFILDPMTWQETEAAFREAIDVPQEVIDRAIQAMGR